MKKIILIILSLMILCVGSVFAPAGGSLTGVSISVDDNNSAATAIHTIGFTTTTLLNGGGTINFTWPAGFTVPAGAGSFDGCTVGGIGVPSIDYTTTSSQTVTLTAPGGLLPGSVVECGFDVTNTQTASADTYKIDIVTSSESGETPIFGIQPLAANYLKFTSGSTTQTAGDNNDVVLSAYDQYDNLVSFGDNNYDGDKTIIFSGANNAPDTTVPTADSIDFGTGTTISFTNGVSSTVSMVLYKTETAEIEVTDGSINTNSDAAYDLDVVVSPAVLDQTETILSASSSTIAPTTGTSTMTLTVKDEYQNLRLTGDTVVFSTTVGTTTCGTLGAVTDNGDGTHTITYTASATKGTCVIGTDVDDDTITITQDIAVFIDKDTNGVFSTGDEGYTTIQAAIDFAVVGDTILVSEGTYYENAVPTCSLKINKSVTIIGTGLPIIDGGNTHEKVAQITADDVVIRGLKFVNSGSGADIGLYLFGVGATYTSDNVVVESCEFTNNKIGVFLAGANNADIKENNFTGNSLRSILVQQDSDDNNFTSNVITMTEDSTEAGIIIGSDSGGNIIEDNTITLPSSGSGTMYSIWLNAADTGDVTIQNNIINGGKRSIQFDGGPGHSGTNTISGNTLTGPSFGGIMSSCYGDFVISDNTITDGVRPMEFQQSGNGIITITGNTINGTTFDGINAGSYSSMTLTNNVFVGITYDALNNRISGEINAENNYWGSVNPNFDNIVSGDVDYRPWYIDSALTKLNEEVTSCYPGETVNDIYGTDIGVCQSGVKTKTCQADGTWGSWEVTSAEVVATESPETTCNDGLDNDCDGLTDLYDTADCTSTTDNTYYTKSESDGLFATITSLTTAVTDMATQTWVNSLGFITKSVSDLTNYYTKTEIDTALTNSDDWDAAFTHVTTDVIETASDVNSAETDPTVLASVKDGVSWAELTGIPAGFADDVDADTTYSDLNEFTDSGNVYQNDVGADCGSGQYVYGINDDGSLDCRNDADSNTQLSEAQVDSYVADNGYALESNDVLDYDSCSDIDQSCLNFYSDSDIGGTESAFNGWDKDVSNDFDGAWTSLTGRPAGLDDGDDDTHLSKADIEAMGFVDGAHTVDTDTQLSEAQVDSYVANNGYALESNDVSDYDSCSDIDQSCLDFFTNADETDQVWLADKGDYYTQDEINARSSLDTTGVDLPLIKGWTEFRLPAHVLKATNHTVGLALSGNYSVDNVLSSINGNFDYLAYYNGSVWKVYVPGEASNTFTEFPTAENTPNYVFSIHMTTTDKLVIASN